MTDPKATGKTSASGWSSGTAVDDPNSGSPAAASAPSDAHPGPPPPPADRAGTTTVLPAVDAKAGKDGPRPPAVPSALDQYAALTAAGQATSGTASTSAGSAGNPAPGAGSPSRTPSKTGRRTPDRAPRRARLQLRHLNVWSVLKFSCVLALALFLVWLIMVAVLYGVLDQLHVFTRVNDTVRTINGDSTTKDVVTSTIVLYGALIIGMVNMVLFIVLSTIGSLVYNLCADLVGGIEVTLAERD